MLGMTEKLAQPTLDLPTAFDAWYLPRRPLCCDADYAQLHRRSRAGSAETHAHRDQPVRSGEHARCGHRCGGRPRNGARGSTRA